MLQLRCTDKNCLFENLAKITYVISCSFSSLSLKRFIMSTSISPVRILYRILSELCTLSCSSASLLKVISITFKSQSLHFKNQLTQNL